MRFFKFLKVAGPVLVAFACFISNNSHAKTTKQELVKCEVPGVDIDVATNLISLINRQQTSCSKQTNYLYVNGKRITGITANEMANVVRMTVFACQDPYARYPSRPVENQCVRELRKDINYFLSTTKSGKVSSYPNPYGVAMRQSRIMGPYIDFELWANYSLYTAR
ncbi:hypothetical protein ACM93F_001068 [Enterobacter ludwigii]